MRTTPQDWFNAKPYETKKLPKERLEIHKKLLTNLKVDDIIKKKLREQRKKLAHN